MSTKSAAKTLTTNATVQAGTDLDRADSDNMLQEALRRLQIAYDQSIVYAKELSEEIRARQQVEAELRQRRTALAAQTKDIEEARTALKVLLERREEDKSELEEKVVANVKRLIFPHIAMLKQTRLDKNQRAIVELIEAHLRNIVSPFLISLKSTYAELTPREVQIADLVKEGKTTKEIAAMIHISNRAVEFHRYNIRSKLGLRNKKANLRSRLSSLS